MPRCPLQRSINRGRFDRARVDEAAARRKIQANTRSLFSKSNCASLPPRCPGAAQCQANNHFLVHCEAKPALNLGEKTLRPRPKREEPAYSSQSSPVSRSNILRSRPLGNRSDYPHAFIQSRKKLNYCDCAYRLRGTSKRLAFDIAFALRRSENHPSFGHSRSRFYVWHRWQTIHRWRRQSSHDPILPQKDA